MSTCDIIREKLTEAFVPQSLKVVDESHQHEGHGGCNHAGAQALGEIVRGSLGVTSEAPRQEKRMQFDNRGVQSAQFGPLLVVRRLCER